MVPASDERKERYWKFSVGQVKSRRRRRRESEELAKLAHPDLGDSPR